MDTQDRMLVSCVGALIGLTYAIIFDEPQLEHCQRTKDGCIIILVAWLLVYGLFVLMTP